MKATEIRHGRGAKADILITILVLGSLWGFLEVVLNDAIRSAGLPYRAGILTGVGMLIMGIAVGFVRRPSVLLGIPVVAILLKQLVVPILGVSVLCKANSCLAVALHALVLGGVVRFAWRSVADSGLARVGTGAASALGSAVPFYFIGLRLAPCSYLLSFNRPGGLASFMGTEGLVWAVFSGILFPAGYLLGATARDPLSSLEAERPRTYYALASGLAAFCWIAAALAIAATG